MRPASLPNRIHHRNPLISQAVGELPTDCHEPDSGRLTSFGPGLRWKLQQSGRKGLRPVRRPPPLLQIRPPMDQLCAPPAKSMQPNGAMRGEFRQARSSFGWQQYMKTLAQGKFAVQRARTHDIADPKFVRSRPDTNHWDWQSLHKMRNSGAVQSKDFQRQYTPVHYIRDACSVPLLRVRQGT
jgi:hypothetical protein